MRSSTVLCALGLTAACACGGAPATPPATAAASPTAPAAPAAGGRSTPTDEPPEPAHLPTACSRPGAPTCTPPGDFVDRLCAKPRQEVALALFGSATPFTRLYLKGKLDELSFDEEVLALRFHGVPKGGIQVGSGNGTWDVLRWDGTCSMAVDADALGTGRPGTPRTARVLWHRIGDKMQTALIVGSADVKKAHSRRGKECQGAMSGDVSAGCQKADAALGDAIVAYVRGGGALPEPEAP